jgi:hypothetical protein
MKMLSGVMQSESKCHRWGADMMEGTGVSVMMCEGARARLTPEGSAYNQGKWVPEACTSTQNTEPSLDHSIMPRRLLDKAAVAKVSIFTLHLPRLSLVKVDTSK